MSSDILPIFASRCICGGRSGRDKRQAGGAYVCESLTELSGLLLCKESDDFRCLEGVTDGSLNRLR